MSDTIAIKKLTKDFVFNFVFNLCHLQNENVFLDWYNENIKN